MRYEDTFRQSRLQYFVDILAFAYLLLKCKAISDPMVENIVKKPKGTQSNNARCWTEWRTYLGKLTIFGLQLPLCLEESEHIHSDCAQVLKN